MTLARTYRNTDLEIRGRAPLDALLAALGDRVLVSHHSRVRGRSFACLNHTRSGLDRTPKRTNARWLELLRPLRGEARRALRASRVTMSVGCDADARASTTIVIAADDVAALGRLGVEIEVVFYRPERVRHLPARSPRGAVTQASSDTFSRRTRSRAPRLRRPAR